MGINLFRDVRDQARQKGFVPVLQWGELGKKGQWRQLRPGDLLFFGKQVNHITHVGIYLDRYAGKRHQFIHASVTDDEGNNNPSLKISDFMKPFWQNRFVIGKRFAMLVK